MKKKKTFFRESSKNFHLFFLRLVRDISRRYLLVTAETVLSFITLVLNNFFPSFFIFCCCCVSKLMCDEFSNSGAIAQQLRRKKRKEVWFLRVTRVHTIDRREYFIFMNENFSRVLESVKKDLFFLDILSY